MSKRTIRLYDMVTIPSFQLSEDKSKFVKDNFFGGQRHSLIARIAATHAGIITRNNGFYLPDKMSGAAASMTKPYPKPVLLHHESHEDPVGRILAAEYVDTSGALIKKDSYFKDFIDPSTSFISKVELVDRLLKDNILDSPDYQGLGYISAIVSITDPEAIQKIADNRYLTVSIGASTDRAVCSICKADWVDEGPCEHRPGKTYEDKKAFIIAGNIMYEELSFVNSPADPFARVIEVQNNAGEAERISLSTDEEAITDEDAEVYLITDDNHCAATLTNKKNISTEEGVLGLLGDIRMASKKEATVLQEEKKETKVEGSQQVVEEKKETDSTEVKVEEPKVEVKEEVKAEEKKEEPKQEEPKVEVKEEKKEEPKVEVKAEDTVVVPPAEAPKEEPKVEEKKEEEPADACGGKKKKKKIKNASTEEALVDETEILQSITLDDVKDVNELTEVLKDLYEFITDKQLEEAIKTIQSEALKDTFVANITKVITDVMTTIFERDFNSDEFYTEIEKELDTVGSDAKLSTAQRKKLPSSTFCGPGRSFPVPDCAHVTAARRLIGRAKATASTKSSILACVSRKAKALGCGSDVKEETQVMTETKQEIKKPEITCDVIKSLTVDEFTAVLKFVQTEAEERKISLVVEKIVERIPEEVTKELETIKATKTELESQLIALRAELKDVYDDCTDLEDAKAEILESLHKERAQRLCELRVLTGDIKHQGELEEQMVQEITKSPEILISSLTTISDKVNLYEIADKLNDGMAKKPQGVVENPTLGTKEDNSNNKDLQQIRDHYNKLVVTEGQRAANSYLNSLRKARLLPSNFKL